MPQYMMQETVEGRERLWAAEAMLADRLARLDTGLHDSEPLVEISEVWPLV